MANDLLQQHQPQCILHLHHHPILFNSNDDKNNSNMHVVNDDLGVDGVGSGSVGGGGHTSAVAAASLPASKLAKVAMKAQNILHTTPSKHGK